METKYFEIMTITESKPWPCAAVQICYRIWTNVNKCEHGWTNFWASFTAVALKLIELFWSELPNHWFSSISYVPLFDHDSWAIVHQQSFSFRWACIYFSLTIHIVNNDSLLTPHCESSFTKYGKVKVEGNVDSICFISNHTVIRIKQH